MAFLMALVSLACALGVVNVYLAISNVFSSEPVDFGRLFGGAGASTVGGFLFLVILFIAAVGGCITYFCLYKRGKKHRYRFCKVFGSNEEPAALVKKIDGELNISKNVDKKSQNLNLFIGRRYIVSQVSAGIILAPVDSIYWAYPSVKPSGRKQICKMHFFCKKVSGKEDKFFVPMPTPKALESLKKMLSERYKFAVGPNAELQKLYKTDYPAFEKKCISIIESKK